MVPFGNSQTLGGVGAGARHAQRRLLGRGHVGELPPGRDDRVHVLELELDVAELDEHGEQLSEPEVPPVEFEVGRVAPRAPHRAEADAGRWVVVDLDVHTPGAGATHVDVGPALARAGAVHYQPVFRQAELRTRKLSSALHTSRHLFPSPCPSGGEAYIPKTHASPQKERDTIY